jgi:hypothetical protein
MTLHDDNQQRQHATTTTAHDDDNDDDGDADKAVSLVNSPSCDRQE